MLLGQAFWNRSAAESGAGSPPEKCLRWAAPGFDAAQPHGQLLPGKRLESIARGQRAAEAQGRYPPGKRALPVREQNFAPGFPSPAFQQGDSPGDGLRNTYQSRFHPLVTSNSRQCQWELYAGAAHAIYHHLYLTNWRCPF